MTFISVVPYNRELLVIKDMDVFTSFFCYAKRQKKGLSPASRPVLAADDVNSIEGLLEDGEDSDLLPVTKAKLRF